VAWAGRLVENGVDVAIYDPHPQAERRTRAMLSNAARAWSKLTLAPRTRKATWYSRPRSPTLCVMPTSSRRVCPKDEAIKRRILADIDAHAAPDALVCSSTSGLLPSRLQDGMKHAERMLVGHPFKPVYLLPMVEVCAGARTSAVAVDRAWRCMTRGHEAFASTQGDRRLRANRLLEALGARLSGWFMTTSQLLRRSTTPFDTVPDCAGPRWERF
jgi:carnitine 3-dehydrogenase